MNWQLILLWDDIQREDNHLRHPAAEHNATGWPQRSSLNEVVSNLEIGPSMKHVQVCQGHADAAVYIIRPPLVLKLAINLEVLWSSATSSIGHHGLERISSVDKLLPPVPRRHVVAMPGPVSCLLLDSQLGIFIEGPITSVVGMPLQERHAEHLKLGLALVVGQKVSSSVQHLCAWNRKPNPPRKQVRGSYIGTAHCVNSKPEGERQEDVASSKVCVKECTEPGWWRNRMQTQTTRARHRGEDVKSNARIVHKVCKLRGGK
mmetsp:Transcript_21294/g.38887  ORF Transcript_21294/g.38887 Transcript_21294/m.38887 type:complete len:261 (+) Transcript_21294:1659-2441(+)